jgi:hypothetical protein
MKGCGEALELATDELELVVAQPRRVDLTLDWNRCNPPAESSDSSMPERNITRFHPVHAKVYDGNT